MKLSVNDLNSFYGPAHILFDIALEVGEVRWWRCSGAWRRQIDTFRSIVGLR